MVYGRYLKQLDESILIALESDLPLRDSRGESKKAKDSDSSVPNSRGTVRLKKKHSKTSGMSYMYNQGHI